jgi:hypothetical protein
MTEVQNFPGGLPTDYRVHLEWVRYNSDLGISTIDNFDLAFVPVGELVREALVPYFITAADDGTLTLTDAGMAELTGNWSAKADTSFANVSVGGTLVVLGDATFACNESLIIDGPSTTVRDIVGSTAGLLRWGVALGNAATEAGSNAGSDLAISRYNDGGTLIDSPLTISRASGVATFTVSPIAPGLLINVAAASTKTIYGQSNGSSRWGLSLGTGGTESGGNVANDFSVSRFSDAGAWIDNPLMINRAGGGITINIAGLTVANLPRLDGVAGIAKNWMYMTAGVLRWSAGANQTAEGGSNAGSDFTFNRYSDAGALIDSPLIINRASGLVTMRGSAAADNAGAGMVGEVISSNVTTGATLTTTVGANITSIPLTAGDWDVSGEVWVSIGTGGASTAHGGINTVSATIPGTPALGTARATQNAAMAASAFQCFSLRPCRVSLAATTTFYLVAQATFASGTVTATGNIIARRAR